MGCGASSSEGMSTSGGQLQLGSSPRTLRRGGQQLKVDAGPPTVWVGHIPTSHAGEAAVRGLFKKFGTVVSAVVRYKPDEKGGQGSERCDKSWAFVTFSSSGEALDATAAEVAIIDPAGLEPPKVLTVRAANVQGERNRELATETAKETAARKSREEKLAVRQRFFSPSEKEVESSKQTSKLGARERLWLQEKQQLQRVQQQDGLRAKEELEEQVRREAAAAELSVPWVCVICSRSNSFQSAKCVACKRGTRPALRKPAGSSSVKSTEKLLLALSFKEGAAAEQHSSFEQYISGSSSGAELSSVHADSFTARQVQITAASSSPHRQLAAPWCTIWIGGIPSSLVAGGADLARRKVKQLFDEFGQVLSVTIRQKSSDESTSGRAHPSWALLTFGNALSVKRAVETGVTARVKGQEIALRVKAADLGQQLQRPETGQLAHVWHKQATAIQAAIRIQQAVRQRKQQRLQKAGKGRRIVKY
jgi:hypothetical protein